MFSEETKQGRGQWGSSCVALAACSHYRGDCTVVEATTVSAWRSQTSAEAGGLQAEGVIVDSADKRCLADFVCAGGSRLCGVPGAGGASDAYVNVGAGRAQAAGAFS